MTKGIDPRIVTIFGVWTSVLLMISGFGPTFFDGALPPAIATAVVKWASIFGAINSVIMTGGAAFSSSAPGPFVAKPTSFTPTVVKILLAAFVLSTFLPSIAMAQSPLPRPRLPFDPLKLNDKTIAGTKVAAEPLVCDFHILTQLKPDNLVEVIKTCVDKQKQELVDTTQRALDSAKSFAPNPDQDAINCLTPALALFKAAQTIPAVTAQDAVPATATTPAIPAVAAQPEREPGLILLFQKYREFVLAGALTSCQSWVNTPVNATVAAGAGAAATGIGAAAILAPKP